jgi:HEAT repeat protein
LFAMGRSCDKHWEKHVLSCLHNQDDDIRSEAVHAAGELEIGLAREALFDLLADEEDVEIRRIIIWALSKIGGEGVRSRLEELLNLEPDEEEADFIDEALENLSFTEDLAQLDLLEIDPDEDLIEEDFEEDEEEE